MKLIKKIVYLFISLIVILSLYFFCLKTYQYFLLNKRSIIDLLITSF